METGNLTIYLGHFQAGRTYAHSEFRKAACATALGCRYVGEVVRMRAQFIIPDLEAASEATDAVPKAAALDDSDSDTQSDDDGLRTLR